MEPRRKNHPLARTLTFCVCDMAKRLFGFDQWRTRAVLWHVRASGRATLSKRERATDSKRGAYIKSNVCATRAQEKKDISVPEPG